MNPITPNVTKDISALHRFPMAQVFNKFVTNANNAGADEVNITVDRNARTVTVTDNGHGFHESDLVELFTLSTERGVKVCLDRLSGETVKWSLASTGAVQPKPVRVNYTRAKSKEFVGDETVKVLTTPIPKKSPAGAFFESNPTGTVVVLSHYSEELEKVSDRQIINNLSTVVSDLTGLTVYYNNTKVYPDVRYAGKVVKSGACPVFHLPTDSEEPLRCQVVRVPEDSERLEGVMFMGGSLDAPTPDMVEEVAQELGVPIGEIFTLVDKEWNFLTGWFEDVSPHYKNLSGLKETLTTMLMIDLYNFRLEHRLVTELTHLDTEDLDFLEDVLPRPMSQDFPLFGLGKPNDRNSVGELEYDGDATPVIRFNPEHPAYKFNLGRGRAFTAYLAEQAARILDAEYHNSKAVFNRQNRLMFDLYNNIPE